MNVVLGRFVKLNDLGKSGSPLNNNSSEVKLRNLLTSYARLYLSETFFFATSLALQTELFFFPNTTKTASQIIIAPIIIDNHGQTCIFAGLRLLESARAQEEADPAKRERQSE